MTVPDVIGDEAVVDDGVRSWAEVGGQRQVAVVDLQRHVIVGEGTAQLLVGVERVAQVGQESIRLHRPEEQREAVGSGRTHQTFQANCKIGDIIIDHLNFIVLINKKIN